MDELRAPSRVQEPLAACRRYRLLPQFTSAQARRRREPAEEIQYLMIHGCCTCSATITASRGEAVLFGLNDTIIAEWRR
jgi:hypothetical protein